MIRNTPWNYVFIRSCIIFLHHIAPVSILFCIALGFLRLTGYRVPWMIEIYCVAETAFYCLVYLPLRNRVQRPAVHPKIASSQERRALSQRCRETVSDPVRYLSRWFLDAPMAEIKRENLKDFFRWAFLNTAEAEAEYDGELEEYIAQTELQLGHPIQPGRGRAKCLRLTLDGVDVLHRSLTWYMCVLVVDAITCSSMLHHSFQFHRPSALHAFSSFPLRPICLFNNLKSPTKKLSYWYRPHTAKNKLPIIFIHGIGIGLYPYVNFLAELNEDDGSDGEDGQTGIIAIELMCVSFRITHEALTKQEICSEVHAILQHHCIDKFVLVTHSYGSVIATHLLHDAAVSPKIGPMLFIDPVTFLLHLPDVAYNFTYRTPTTAAQHQLHYFGSKDPGVLHTLSRRFFWSESILWKADLAGRRTTVVLAGRDLIVDTRAVARHLMPPLSTGAEPDAWKSQAWRGEGLDVLWFDELDHMQVLDAERDRATLVKVVRAYCEDLGGGSGDAKAVLAS